ncbi:MAG: phage major capsid protein [Oscillospiraceae bacterium]|nr:phage major capsid protein [Oscillospiraceae bacterium]
MVKQLKINIMLERAKRSLAELLEKQADYESRKAGIEERLNAAETLTDAEIDAIDADLTALEGESEGLAEQIRAAEAEVERLETELGEIGKQPAPKEEKREEKGEIVMEKKFFVRSQLRTALEPYAEREEVKTWLGQVRTVGKVETRGVPGGEYTVPVILVEPLRELVAKYSKLLKYVNLKPVKGKARQPIVGTVPEAVWTEMVGTLNELDMGLNVVEVDGYKVGGYIPVPNSLLEDSDIDLLIEVMDMLAKSIAYGLDKAIMYGGGIKQPLGIVTRLASATAPRDYGAGAPTYTDLSATHIGYLSSASLTPAELFAELAAGLGKAQSRYAVSGKFWAMSETTFSTLQTKLISLNAAGAIATGAEMVMPIVGGDIVLLDFMPANVIAGGYGNLYLLSEREGVAISQSEHAQFIQDNTVFKGIARYDGLPVIGEGFAMFTLATSSGATSMDFAEDKANAADAWLTALSVKNGSTTVEISPTFDKETLSYTASVAAAVSSVTVSGTARSGGKVGAIKKDGTAAAGGVCSLSAGANTVTVEAVYGTSKRTYTIVITKASS